MALLQADKLTKEYENHSIIRKVSVDIRENEAFALIGPTGSGKTTLIRMLDLLELPTSGKVYFDGIDVTHEKHEQLHARRRMSYVQQKPVVFTMSVFDNIACGLKWRHENSKLIKQRVNDALNLIGMADFMTRNAKTLSGGETQRVAIARALVTNPEILFLDEPTANLDPISTMKVEKVIHNIIQERRVAVVMATHDMVLGQQLAKRIGVLLDGQLMQVGNPNEIFSSPINQKVAEFVGVENMLSGKVIERNENVLTINVSDNIIQAMPNHLFENEVYVLIRPEDIIFSISKNTSSARNMLRGTVSKLIEVGPLIRLEINCGFPLIGLITRSSASELGLEIGKDIYASFKVTATHVIKRLILKDEEKLS